jgi:hypothetical protein
MANDNSDTGMKVGAPEACALWNDPERLSEGGVKRHFELLETFVDESHWWRYLLKCRECGHLYFFEFHEEIDWQGGNDPQASTYIPVTTEAEIETLKASSPVRLALAFPRLVRDWPKDAEAPKTYWLKG